ncbi:MAG: hypothetical protein ACK4PR_07595, partial [Gammaproteobacteria bacterium]
YSQHSSLTNNNKPLLAEWTEYKAVLAVYFEEMTKLREQNLAAITTNDRTQRYDQATRQRFCNELNNSVELLQQAASLYNHLTSLSVSSLPVEAGNIVQAKQDILSAILTQAQTIVNDIEDILKKENPNQRDLEKFNHGYNDLEVWDDHLKFMDYQDKSKLSELIKKVNDMIDQKLTLQTQRVAETVNKSGITINDVINSAVISLVNMKLLADRFPVFKDRVNENINLVIIQLQEYHRDAISILSNQLLKSGPIGISIIKEHECFSGERISGYNRKTQGQGIEYVLKSLEATDSLAKDALHKRYTRFLDSYKKYVKCYLNEKVDFDSLVADIKLVAGRYNPQKGWSRMVTVELVPEIMAGIFALWTLQGAKYYFNSPAGLTNRENYLLQPHPAQVIAIFRMLGVADNMERINNALENNLVEIKTGEGKSVTLAVAASVLALLGMEVSCACYSEYLTERDYKAFKPMFDQLAITDHIHYGTFNRLCEDVVNEDGDIRQRVQNLISNKDIDDGITKLRKRKSRVLLIDEVDVFFNRDFYGNIYTPTTSLQDYTISNLVKLIWRTRNIKTYSLGMLKNSPEFKACCQRYQSWSELIEEAAKDMLADVKAYHDSHEYEVHEDKIAYKEQDGISFKKVVGYKTMFAYFHENERGLISDASLHNNIQILIHCGSFSYAEMPRSFDYIMGVTGTLRDLSQAEKEIIRQYNITKYTYIPSIYGTNVREFVENRDTKLIFRNQNQSDETYKADFFLAIQQTIDPVLKEINGEKGAVLIFFESEKILEEFRHSDAMNYLKNDVRIMTEKMDPAMKEAGVKQATMAGQITLLTRSFGRGTDFSCDDQAVINRGGVAIIQVFLSKEKSEETQIKGRTARQGQKGSYKMILLADDLEKLGVTKNDIDLMRTNGTDYKLLDKRRNEFFEIEYATNKNSALEAKAEHNAGKQFITDLNAKATIKLKKYLCERNKGVNYFANSRTLCLMDATGSMSHLLKNAKATVGTMFNRASEVLRDNGYEPNAFQVQFAVYRNYNSQEDKI